MEQYSHDLYRAWSEREDVTLLANPGGNAELGRFMLRAAGTLLTSAADFDFVHLADGVLSAFIPLIRARSRARIGITVHGLDITYDRYGFQAFVPRLVGSADRVVCVSSYTKQACTSRGIQSERITVIPNALNLADLPKNDSYDETSIQAKHGPTLDRPVLFSVGRLVKRKGHAWFVREYMPALRDRYTFVIAGTGPEAEEITALARKLGLSESVRLIGSIDDAEKAFWLDRCRATVMPNIRVPHDPEGFGISVLESIAFRRPVFTTGIEGIADQMSYCYPLARLLESELPARTDAEWESLRATIDWRRVVDGYVALA
jgi:glycosyltransferase involved in cell wall biosynthesis